MQTITQDLSDLPLLHDRRVDVMRIVSGMNADIGKANPGVGVDWGSADWLGADWA